MDEQWRPVKGYEGLYEVSSIGRVKSLGRKTSNGSKPPRMLVLQRQWTGYMQVGLSLPRQKQKWLKVHRLVAEAFIPNPNNKPYINHKNGIKDDNRVENLEWVTRSENQLHAIHVLGIEHPRGSLGKPSPRRKLSRKQVEEIRLDNRSQATIAKDYGVCQQTISNIKTGLMYTIWPDDE